MHDLNKVCRWCHKAFKGSKYKDRKFCSNRCAAFHREANKVPRTREDILLSFKGKYQVTSKGCWVWKGAKWEETNYGQMRIGGKLIRAHRVSYLLFKGEIPAGTEIDHLCRNKLCVNPDHLEAVTHQVNMQRAYKFKNKENAKH